MTDPAERLLRVLLSPSADTVRWMDLALCQETDPDAFFAEKGEPTLPAKRVCRACPVQAQCLDYAVEHNILWGVWGGTSPRERRAIRRQQERQVAA